MFTEKEKEDFAEFLQVISNDPDGKVADYARAIFAHMAVMLNAILDDLHKGEPAHEVVTRNALQFGFDRDDMTGEIRS